MEGQSPQLPRKGKERQRKGKGRRKEGIINNYLKIIERSMSSIGNGGTGAVRRQTIVARAILPGIASSCRVWRIDNKRGLNGSGVTTHIRLAYNGIISALNEPTKRQSP